MFEVFHVHVLYFCVFVQKRHTESIVCVYEYPYGYINVNTV